ncbi:MAG: phenylalanine--tRNA ligase subunit beta [Ornithinimicrobium sp.]
MLVPVPWLAEYVDLPADVSGEQIAAALVRVGLEEEGLSGGDVTGPLVVGRVLEMTLEPQKNGKTINWCRVDVGQHGQQVSDGTPQGIVCGAHNFSVGDLVAVILPGGVLPGDFEISARKTYGHVSAGMFCSAKELGLGQESDGIIVLSDYFGAEADALEPGDDLIAAFGLDQEVVEINVTPDRGYCFSLRGVAREYSHSTDAAFTDPAERPVDGARAGGFAVELRDEQPIQGVAGCDRYVARIVRDLDLTAPTPRWMASRLTQAGMRPISLAVDVTNYVMLAMGQPLHAFDLAHLTGPIVVRRAGAGESLTTLDDVTRTLHTEDLVITDAGGGGSGGESSGRGGGEGLAEAGTVLALAGVMGGQSSEVSATTTDVLIESAHFDARTVGRTARRHRLPSEASKRFERGVDPDLCDVAAQMATDLLVEFGAGRGDPLITDVDHRRERTPIDLDLSLPSRYVGVDYSRQRVIEVLEVIGCVVQPQHDEDLRRVAVLPPSWRPDLVDPTTLVEEVARIDGYDKIPSLVPAAPGGRGLSQHQRLRRSIGATLAGHGLTEVLTYPFTGTKRFDELGLSHTDPRRAAVVLANPLSDEAPLMRTELLQTLPDALRRNIARGAKDVALFEIDTLATATGRSAPTPTGGCVPDDTVLSEIRQAVPPQPWHVAMIASGAIERTGWWGKGRGVQASDAVAWARAVAEVAGLREVRAVAEARMPWHPGRCVRLSWGHGEDEVVFGWAGELHPKVIAALGLAPRTVAAELDLDVVAARSVDRAQAQTISTHSAATSDVALQVARAVPNADVEASLRVGAGELLESIALFDVYAGDQIEATAKSLAFRLTFRAADRTLRTEEVNDARDAAVRRAASDHGAVQR